MGGWHSREEHPPRVVQCSTKRGCPVKYARRRRVVQRCSQYTSGENADAELNAIMATPAPSADVASRHVTYDDRKQPSAAPLSRIRDGICRSTVSWVWVQTYPHLGPSPAGRVRDGDIAALTRIGSSTDARARWRVTVRPCTPPSPGPAPAPHAPLLLTLSCLLAPRNGRSRETWEEAPG